MVSNEGLVCKGMPDIYVDKNYYNACNTNSSCMHNAKYINISELQKTSDSFALSVVVISLIYLY